MLLAHDSAHCTVFSQTCAVLRTKVGPAVRPGCVRRKDVARDDAKCDVLARHRAHGLVRNAWQDRLSNRYLPSAARLALGRPR